MYEPKEVHLRVTNSFTVQGDFRVLLYESQSPRTNLHSKLISSAYLQKRKREYYDRDSDRNFSMYVGTDDGFELFHFNNEQISLDHGCSKDITMRFVPLKETTRHCFVVFSDKDVGDIVYSITAIVNKPLPTIPETLCSQNSTVVNSETRTLHLHTSTSSIVKESIIIRNTNLLLEDALLELSKWELSKGDAKRQLLTESLNYAAFITGISNLCSNNFLELCHDDSGEVMIFSIEGSDDTHFSFPDHVKVPTVATGM